MADEITTGAAGSDDKLTDAAPVAAQYNHSNATPSSGDYNASMIKSLDDVEHVRTRPGMYIGGYNPRGLHHLVYEIVDNSIDEVLAGHAKHVDSPHQCRRQLHRDR